MKFFKESIILFALLLILSAGGVCAAELNESDALLADETSSYLADAPASEVNGSFSDLSNEISLAGAELNITRDYTFNAGTDGNYTKGISIYKKDLIIYLKNARIPRLLLSRG